MDLRGLARAFAAHIHNVWFTHDDPEPIVTVSLSLSHWYPGTGVVLDCIDSWSLRPYFLTALDTSSYAFKRGFCAYALRIKIPCAEPISLILWVGHVRENNYLSFFSLMSREISSGNMVRKLKITKTGGLKLVSSPYQYSCSIEPAVNCHHLLVSFHFSCHYYPSIFSDSQQSRYSINPFPA